MSDDEGLAVPRFAIGSVLVEVKAETDPISGISSSRHVSHDTHTASTSTPRDLNTNNTASVMRLAKHCHDKRRRSAKNGREEHARVEATPSQIVTDLERELQMLNSTTQLPESSETGRPAIVTEEHEADRVVTNQSSPANPSTNRWTRLGQVLGR